MLRVAVVGADAADWNVVASRMRHARLERCAGTDPADPAWSSADAVAFVGDAQLDSPLAEAVLAGGKHLLIATQSVTAISDLDRWTELACAHRVRLEVVNPLRVRPSRRLIRQQIENGKFGDVGLVRIGRSVPPQSNVGERRPSARITDAMIGDLDLALWLIGRAPDSLFAIRRPVEIAGCPDAECLHVHLGFPHGSMALITQTPALPGGDASESLSVIAFSGAAYADDHQNRQLLLSGGPASAPLADEGDALAFLLDDFAGRVQSSIESTDSRGHWRRLATIADAVDRSATSHQAIPLELV